MAITPRTRKRLWSRAGNRCALCKCLLVQPQEAGRGDVIIGVEAHIISAKPKGPRYRVLPRTRIDDYDNFVLLCGNDHTRVDVDTAFYSEEVLREAKLRHERWIEQVIARSMGEKRSLQEALDDSVLPRLRTGTDVVNLMHGTLANSWGWQPLNTVAHAEAAGPFADYVNELSDALRFFSFETQAKAEVVLTKRIEKLEAAGLFLYGKKMLQLAEVPGGREELLAAIFRLTNVDHDVFIDLGLVPRELLIA